MQICPICFWEDSPGEAPWNTSNSVTLAEAQENFSGFGACERDYLDVVRPAAPDEQRPEDWLSFEDQANAIIGLIENSFAEVKLGDGLTIHQREAISDYQSEEETNARRRLDPETRWEDISDEKIDKYGTSLVFLDPESIRYHLPAFMRFVIGKWLEFHDAGDGDAVLYGLAGGPRSEGYHRDSFLLLNNVQNTAVAAFLEFVSRVDSVYGTDAEKGLHKGWSAYLPSPISNSCQ